MSQSFSINDIEDLFLRVANRPCEGHPQQQGEPAVTVLQHALQCAQLAEWADADEALVAAAFLHGLGSVLPEKNPRLRGDVHLAACLQDNFGPDVTEPIRLYAQARRYLAATDAQYASGQTAPMTQAEAKSFEATAYATDAVHLARWHFQAQTPAQSTPPLDYYLALLEDLQRQQADRDKVEVGPQTVS